MLNQYVVPVGTDCMKLLFDSGLKFFLLIRENYYIEYMFFLWFLKHSVSIN